MECPRFFIGGQDWMGQKSRMKVEGREQGGVLGDRQWTASPLLNICGVWGSAVSSPSGVRDARRFSTIFSTLDGLY